MRKIIKLILATAILFIGSSVYAASELSWQSGKQESNVSIYELYRSPKFKGRYGNEVLMFASLSKDNTRLLLVYQTGIQVVDTKNYATLYTNRQSSKAAFSPDGKLLVIYTDGSRVKLVDTATWNEIAMLDTFAWIPPTPFSNDSKKLATTSYEGIFVWSVETRKPILRIVLDREESFYTLRFTPDDKKILVISFDKSKSMSKYISMFDTSSGARLWRFKLNNTFIDDIKFSSDGKRLLAADGADGGSIKMWDSATGQELINYKGHTKFVTSADFSKDGKQIATAAGGSVHILDATSGSVLASTNDIKQAYGNSYISSLGNNSLLFGSGNYIKLIGYYPNLAYEYFSVYIPNIYITKVDYLEAEKKIFIKGQYEFVLLDISSNYLELTAEKTKIKMSDYLSIPLIPKPTLPPVQTVTKDEFETTKDFEARVNKVKMQREDAIAKLQDDYRKAVEERNKELESRLKNKQNMELTYLKESLLEVLGKPSIKDLIYDADKQIMHAKLTAEHSTFNKDIAIEIEPEKARQLKTNAANYDIQALFDVSNDLITLKDVKIKGNTETYAALLSEKEYVPQKVAVTLEDKKVDFSAMQNPNLIDKYQVQMVGYADGNTKQKYNDDLTPLVKAAKAVTQSPKKWLFAIAIENYTEADSVIFAKNSAEAFIAAAKKRFGIDDRHTYAYIDDKATGNSIKNNLDRFLTNVKAGDTIYFYYSGHGIPSPVDGEAFILPKDAIADYITNEHEFMARTIYKKLGESKAAKVFAFIDSCYSGKTDNISNIKGVAAGVFKTKKVEFDKTKMVVMTAGTSGQFSNAFNEKGHRLFTYYLTKAILDRPTLDIESLYQEVALKVKDESFKKGDIYKQEPQIEGNTKLEL